MEIWIKLFSIIISLIGIIFIYDAREIIEKRFSFSDKNEGTKMLKTVGFICAIIGILVFCA